MNEIAKRPSLKTVFDGILSWILLTSPFAAALWLWEDARWVPLHVLNGSLFRSSWWAGHAGFCLDQPTIGKWYFWVTIFSGAWCLLAIFASRVCRSLPRLARRAYALATLAIAAFHLCVLTVPFTWTIQYVHAMGVTHHRLIALAWGAVGYVILIGLTTLFVRQAWRTGRSQTDRTTRQASPKESPCTP